jgi:hypothetical protein
VCCTWRATINVALLHWGSSELMASNCLALVSSQVAPSAPQGLAAGAADTGCLHATWQPPAADHGESHLQSGCPILGSPLVLTEAAQRAHVPGQISS